MTSFHRPAPLRLVSAEGMLTFDLPANGELLIGRAPSSDIVLTEPTVSRRHAVLTVTLYGVILTDQGALSGTFVNDRQVTGAEAVRVGDTLRLGAVELVLVDADGHGQRRWWLAARTARMWRRLAGQVPARTQPGR